MAIVKRELPTASTPSYTPDIEDDYNNQNEYIEGNSRGKNAVSLTNWDGTTTKPQIVAGSFLEINGAIWDFTTNTDIDTSGATSGVIYVYFDDGTPEFKFLDTAPTWSATLNGWYTSGDRFTGHLMTWDGASSYTVKQQYINNTANDGEVLVSSDGNLAVSGDTDISGNLTVDGQPVFTSTLSDTVTNAPQTNQLLPAGILMLLFTLDGGGSSGNDANYLLEINADSAWVTVASVSQISTTATKYFHTVVSNGSNVRYTLDLDGSAVTASLRYFTIDSV